MVTLPLIRSFRRIAQVAGMTLVIATWISSLAVAADDPFEDLRMRVEQLEAENKELQETMESVKQDSTDTTQNSTISELQRSLSGLSDKVNKKTLPSVQINGVFQTDAGFFHQSSDSLHTYGPIQDGADFRRARLSAKGAITDTTNYFFQMDFGFFGRPTFTDVWVEQTKVPLLGNVKVGQWKQPFSLEVVSSFRYTTFVERSLLFQAFTPFRHLGVGFYDCNDEQTITWAASGFTTGQDQFGGSITNSGGWGTAERLTILPYWDDATKGESYLHLGLGHYFNAPPNHVNNFRTIPELYIGQNAPGVVGTSGQAAPGAFNGTPFFAQTGALGINHYNVLGTEMLWVDGPLSLQSEGMLTFVDQSTGILNGAAQTVNFANGNSGALLGGAYAQVGYFLTGEHRPYDRKTGTIDRIIPKHNFGPWACDTAHGWGAWEAAARWSYLDLNSHNIHGGTVNDMTLGMNWYLNPYWKVQFNYIRSMPNYTPQLAPAGTPSSPFSRSSTDMFDLRCQVDF
jgi:phosphate-selective porin OprO/OprP